MHDNNEEISILEQYHMKAIKIFVICGIIGIITGFSILNITNCINDNSKMSNNQLIIIDLFVVIPELVILTIQLKRLIYKGKLNKNMFNQIKVISGIITVVNFYILTLFTPSKEVWCSAFFLAMIQSLYLSISKVITLNIIITASIIVIYFLQKSEEVSEYLFFQELIIRIIMTILIMLIITINVYCSGKILLNLKEEKERWLAQYLKNVEENQNQIREIKHNLKNQAIILKSIINEKNFEEADRFIDNMISGTENLNLITYTENIAINSIINYKVDESRKFNIKWNIDVQLDKNININIEDLETILGNLLDNAIEACYLVEDCERKIDFKIYNRKNSIIICIINTKNMKKSLEKTWKSDKLNHGIGLKSVKKLVDRYNGAMKNEDKGKIYEVNIILWT